MYMELNCGYISGPDRDNGKEMPLSYTGMRPDTSF